MMAPGVPGRSALRARAGGPGLRSLFLAVLVASVLVMGNPGGGWAQEVVVAEAPPVPVLVIPGWYETGMALAGLRARFRVSGYPASHVAAVTFDDPVGGNREHAAEMAVAVEHLLERTGQAQVDIVAHSMGGLATRVYLQEHPGRVRRVVFLATPHRGTVSAYLAFGKGREEMLPGSAFLSELNAVQPVPPGVEALTVRTLLDTHILPGSSATLPGVQDVTVCCPTHAGLTRDLEAFQAVLGFLRRERP